MRVNERDYVCIYVLVQVSIESRHVVWCFTVPHNWHHIRYIGVHVVGLRFKNCVRKCISVFITYRRTVESLMRLCVPMGLPES